MNCAACNGLLEESSGPGRSYHWKGEPIPLPDDFVFARCDDCDADWLYEAHYERLDRLIGERQAFQGRAQMVALQMALAFAWALHFSFAWKCTCGCGRAGKPEDFILSLKPEIHELFGGGLERQT